MEMEGNGTLPLIITHRAFIQQSSSIYSLVQRVLQLLPLSQIFKYADMLRCRRLPPQINSLKFSVDMQVKMKYWSDSESEFRAEAWCFQDNSTDKTRNNISRF
jgi:hypothetical protein